MISLIIVFILKVHMLNLKYKLITADIKNMKPMNVYDDDATLPLYLTCKHSGCKCPKTGLLNEDKTLCEQFEGPGPINVLLGTYNERFKTNGGGTSIFIFFSFFLAFHLQIVVYNICSFLFCYVFKFL